MSQYYRKFFFSNLVKEAALKADDIKVLQDIFVSKYQDYHAARGLAVQYYDKFIKKSDPNITLTEDTLPQPLPPTIEEIRTLLRSVDTVRGKSRSEELSEELKSKHPDIDLTNLNEDYLSWLHRKYVKGETKPNEITHPIEEALVTLRKFPSIQDKVKSIPEFKKKVEEAGYLSISSVKDLTLDDMEKIISLDDTELTVRIHGVEIKDEEFLGKFGEWNLWLPHTKESSVKIAGYDDDYNPKTTWCTGRTKGSNLFYNYIGRSDYPTFLFYIIKDNPVDANDWLSLGYVSSGGRLVPDFSGRYGGLSVERDNKGLKESDYSMILEDQWHLIRSRIESEIERHKVEEEGREKYVSPARSIIESLAKDVEGFKRELKPKSNEEKKDFINVILDSNPSDEVKDISAKEYLRIDPYKFLRDFSEAEWAKPYIPTAAPRAAESNPYDFLYKFSNQEWAKPYIPIAAPKAAELKPYIFLTKFSEEEWAKPYIDTAVPKAAESEPFFFLYNFSRKEWAKPYIPIAATKAAKLRSYELLRDFLREEWAKPHIDTAASNLAESDPYLFLTKFSEKEWAKPHIDTAASKVAESRPYSFLLDFSRKEWAKPHIDTTASKYAESRSYDFLNRFSKQEWASPYIPIAAPKAAKSNPYGFLSYFSDREWAKPYIPIAALQYAESNPFDFLLYSLKEEWAKPYIPIAATNAAELNPSKFLTKFSKKEWANTKTTTPAGEMTWIEYAKKIKNDLGKTSSNVGNINIKLLKLSNVLSRLNFEKEALLIKKLY